MDAVYPLMPAVSHSFSRRTAPTTRRRVRHPHRPASRASTAPAAVVAATVSAQRCGASEDFALYRCFCGCDFHAAVSTTVGCPACGAAQDW